MMSRFTDGPTFDVRVVRDIRIPMRDGIRLAATLYMPEAPGPFPALLESLPYRKDDLYWPDSAPPHYYFAARGYVGVRLDLRGTGSSEGVSVDEYSEVEQDDTVEAIAWLAAQPWCTGAVGMFGISYGGFTSLQAATHAPPALRAIVPMHASDDRYTDDCHYAGGCLRDYDTGRYGNRMLGWSRAPPDPEVVGPDWLAIWEERLRNSEPWLLQWLRHQVDGPYWRSGSVRPDYARIQCPIFAIGGFRETDAERAAPTASTLPGPGEGLDRSVAASASARSAARAADRLAPRGAPLVGSLAQGPRHRDAGRAADHDLCPGLRPAALHPRPPGVATGGTRRRGRPPALSTVAFAPDLGGELVPAPNDPGDPPTADRDWAAVPAVAEAGLAGGIFSAGGVPFGLPLDQRADEGRSLVYTFGSVHGTARGRRTAAPPTPARRRRPGRGPRR